MVAMKRALRFHEEIMLLALKDREGTIAAGDMGFPYALGGALLAELLILGRISLVEVRKKTLVELADSTPVGDAILDECLQRLRDARRRGSLNTWVSRFAGLRRLKHRIAQQLCRRGILRADEASVLLIFKRKVYPELDPGPEREVVARLRRAIFNDEEEQPDSRTSVLVALGDLAGVLKNAFDRKDLKARKDRIEKIGEGDATAAAVRQVVQSVKAAVVAATAAAAAASAAT